MIRLTRTCGDKFTFTTSKLYPPTYNRVGVNFRSRATGCSSSVGIHSLLKSARLGSIDYWFCLLIPHARLANNPNHHKYLIEIILIDLNIKSLNLLNYKKLDTNITFYSYKSFNHLFTDHNGGFCYIRRLLRSI